MSISKGMRTAYAIVIELTDNCAFTAYAPDLPDCRAIGETAEEAEANLREAITFHIDQRLRRGEPIPAPVTRTIYLEFEITR